MGVKKKSFRFHFLKSSSYPIFAKKKKVNPGLVWTPTLVLDETFCDDHFPRILAATSPASVTIDGVVKLRMEEEGMGARSPISCYSTIRFDDMTMMFMLTMMEEKGMGARIIGMVIIINMAIDEEHDDGGEGMGTIIITRLINHDDDADDGDNPPQPQLHDQEHGGQIPRKAGVGGPHAEEVDVSI